MNARKLILPTLAATLGALAITAAPALAAEAPVIVSAKSSGETRETANIEANVNPGGEEAGYAIEYGPSTSYDLNVTGRIPAGSAEVPVERELTELKGGIEYHWRLTVKNNTGVVTSLDHTFVYTLGGGGLPDDRQYELVTPAEKDGALVGAAFNGGIGSQVADQGARMMSFSLQCFAGSPSCEISGIGGQGVPFEFAREPSGGWVTHPLAPSAGSFAPGPASDANVDAGAVLFQNAPSGESGHFEELDWLAGQNGSFSEIGPLGEPGTKSAGEVFPEHELATSSFSHLVYESKVPFWKFDPNFKSFKENFYTVPSLYEYEGFGTPAPRLVAIAPNSTELVSTCGSFLGGRNRYKYNALSEDGETLYFRAKACTENEEKKGGISKVKTDTLYVRYEHARSELISGPASSAPVAGEACNSACQANPPAFSNFEGASSDGSRVFFMDPHQLTDGASEENNPETENPGQEGGSYCTGTPEGSSGCNLYESECPNRCVNPSERRLVDVSAGDKPAGGPRVLATVAISTDGSHVYFVARGVLTGANREGHAPVDGEPNLYVYERDGSVPGGHLVFVATLSSEDEEIWAREPGIGFANVTPDGRFLVFDSHAALTPDDTPTAASPPVQVYRYDAETETLQRVSIGAQGFHDNGNEGTGFIRIVEAEHGLKRFIDPSRPDPTMSDDGSFVFFQSPIGLTPHALNDVLVGENGKARPYAQNIYEWEAPGTEVNGQVPCSEPTGCLSLISDGKDVAENDNKDPGIGSSAFLLGSSGSGANVFFTTSDELVPQDTDTERDFYDAHICSTEEPCPSSPEASPPCLGEVCHGIPAAQQGAPTGGTLTLNGLGNIGPAAPAVKPKALTRAQKLAAALKVCHKDRRRAKRVACEAKAHKQFGAAKKVKKGRK